MSCTNCGSALYPQAAYCGTCGQPTTPPAWQSTPTQLAPAFHAEPQATPPDSPQSPVWISTFPAALPTSPQAQSHFPTTSSYPDFDFPTTSFPVPDFSGRLYQPNYGRDSQFTYSSDTPSYGFPTYDDASPSATPAYPEPTSYAQSSSAAEQPFTQPQPYSYPVSPAPQPYAQPDGQPISPAPAQVSAPPPAKATAAVPPAPTASQAPIPAPISSPPAALPPNSPPPQAPPQPGQLYGPPPIQVYTGTDQPYATYEDPRPPALNRFDIAAILLALAAILVSPMGIVLPPAFGILAILCGVIAHRRAEPQGKLSLTVAAGATALGMLAAIVIALL